MQESLLSNHTYVFGDGGEEMTFDTVEPELARMVLGSRLVPAHYKREYLRATDKSASAFIVDQALQSELFCDVMLQLGVMTVHKTTKSTEAPDPSGRTD